MPTFHYKSIQRDGGTAEGNFEAKDKFDLVRALKEKGETVIYAAEENERKWDLKRINLLVARVKLREKIVFTRNLAAMVDAGIPVSRALEILVKQTKNPKFQDVLTKISEDIKSGQTLSDGMAKYPEVFSGLFIAMMHAGEESGKLPEALHTVGSQLEQSYSLRRKVKGAMMYPSIVLAAMFIIAIIMFIYVVPSITSTFKEFDVELPASTKVIMAISDFLVAHTVLATLAIVLFIAGIWSGVKTRPGKRGMEWVVLHFPLIGNIVKQYNAAQTSRTLASLFASGVSVVESLEITKEVVQNSYFKEVIEEAKDVVQKGIPISSPFIAHEGLYPTLVGEMMQVGEETGKLSEMLEKISTFYEEEVTSVTKDLSTVIEPILMIFIAGGVGFFAVAMISPMYTLTASI